VTFDARIDRSEPERHGNVVPLVPKRDARRPPGPCEGCGGYGHTIWSHCAICQSLKHTTAEHEERLTEPVGDEAEVNVRVRADSSGYASVGV